MTILHQITPITWITIAGFLFLVIIRSFKLDRKFIFYHARKERPWARKYAMQLYEDIERKKIRDKIRRKDKAIKLAMRYSEANHGRRMYVVPVYDDFVVVDSKNGLKWLKANHFNPNQLLCDIAVFYTPDVRKTEVTRVIGTKKYVK